MLRNSDLNMGWKTELGKDDRGSRPRSVLVTDGERELVAERLEGIVGRNEVTFSPEDQWQPRGKPDVREVQLDKQLKDGAVLLSSAMRRQMKNWWLAGDGHGRGVPPELIIANECLHGEGAPHCQDTTPVFDTISRAEATRVRIGDFG